MATKRLRPMRNQTRKRKHEKKGGSIQCVYDKPSSKLHITISRGMLDGNLSAIRTACETAIKDASPEKAVKKAPPEKAVKESSPEKAVKESSTEKEIKKYSKEKAVKQSSLSLKKHSPKEIKARPSDGAKHIFNFPTEEDIRDDWKGKGILLDGRRPSE